MKEVLDQTRGRINKSKKQKGFFGLCYSAHTSEIARRRGDRIYISFITQVLPLYASDGKEIRNKEDGEFDQIISHDCQIYSDAHIYL